MSEQSTTPPPPQPAGPPTNTQPAFTPPPFSPPPAGDGPAGPVLTEPVLTEPAKPSKGKTVLRKLAGVAITLVVVIVVGTIWSAVTGDPSVANTGDCLVGESSDDIKVVGCDDAKAQWKVLDEVEGVTEAEFDAAAENYTGCSAHPTVEAWFWSGSKGGKGDVLCLEPIKK